MSRINKDGMDKMVDFMMTGQGMTKEEALEKVLSFGPKLLKMRGLLMSEGWRDGYTKKPLEKRTEERRRREKNRRKTRAKQRSK